LAARAVQLARPDRLRRSNADLWAYAAEPHHLVFEAEIRRLEDQAVVAAAPPQAAASAAAAMASAEPGVTARVQRALNSRGLGAGTADGVAGPRTREAIRAWQRSLGEPATGELTAVQLRRLLGSGAG
jgi:hypothetical protein